MPGKRLHVDYLPKKKKALPGCEQPLSNFRPPPPYTVYDKALSLTPGTVLPSRGIFAAPVPARTIRTAPAGPEDADFSLQFALPRYGMPSSMNSYLRTKAPMPNPVRPYDALNESFVRTASKYPTSATGSYPPEFPSAGKGHFEGKRPPGTWSNSVWRRPGTAPVGSEAGGDAGGDKNVTFSEGERPSTAAAPQSYTYQFPVGYYPGNNTASRAKVPNAIKPRAPVYGDALHYTRSRYPTAPTNYPPMFPKAGFLLSESYKVPKLPPWER